MPDSALSGVLTSAFHDTFLRQQVVAQVTSSTRPTAIDGRLVVETDTDNIMQNNGTTWTRVGGQGAFLSYAPTLTGSTTNPTLGTGGSSTGGYQRSGRDVKGWGYILFGSAGTAAGSGTYSITPPVTASAAMTAAGIPVGTCHFQCAGVSGFAIVRTVAAGFDFRVVTYGATAVAVTGFSNVVPGAWTANDFIRYNFAYEAAAD